MDDPTVDHALGLPQMAGVKHLQLGSHAELPDLGCHLHNTEVVLVMT
ncbi:MAG: hypothetical protein R2706_00520 [Acidimicrobiales bacterium]